MRTLKNQAEKTAFDVAEALGAYSWDFPDSKHDRNGLHSIHPYPAKFIPEIPRALIAQFPPEKGTCVFDPFCGSGTTLAEAQKAGHDSIGVDLNPIACRISRVKTTRLHEGLGYWAEECKKAAVACFQEIPTDIPNLDHWFKKDISEAVAALKFNIHKVAPKEVREGLELALSAILVRVSNQDSDTRYAAVEKNLSAYRVYELFVETARKIESAVMGTILSGARSEVIECNILELRPEQIKTKVGLVVTSPPYPNAYEYWLYHKYRMWWLGHDAHKVREKEIGARAHFFGGRAKIGDFNCQMDKVFELLRQVCAPNATVCFVVGDSKIHGEIIDNSDIICRAGESNGFTVAGRVTRTMRGSKKSFNLAHARIKEEEILILKAERKQD